MISSPRVQRLGIAALNTVAMIAPRAAGKVSYEIFCTPPRGAALDDTEQKLAAKLSPLFDAAEAHRITTPDAIVQAYCWRTEPSQRRGQVLLVHGWTAQAMVMGLFVKPLLTAGFDVVAVDLPAHGHSTGRRLSMPIGANALLAVGDTLGPFTGIVTHSFGGLIAALTVEGGSPLTRRLALDRLVLISSPNALQIATKQFADGLGFNARLHSRLELEIETRARRPMDEITTGNLLRTSGVRALVVHDRDDDDVAFSEAEALVATVGSNATLEPTSGLGHRRIVVMPHVIRRAVRFLGE